MYIYIHIYIYDIHTHIVFVYTLTRTNQNILHTLYGIRYTVYYLVYTREDMDYILNKHLYFICIYNIPSTYISHEVYIGNVKQAVFVLY